MYPINIHYLFHLHLYIYYAIFIVDLVLLASLEAGRITDNITPIMPIIAAANTNSSLDNFSNEFLRICSYCGHYSGQSSKRVDVASVLKPFGFEFSSDGAGSSSVASSLLYNVYPQVTNFAEASQSLQVTENDIYCCFFRQITHK